MTGKGEDNLRVVLSRLYESNTSWMPIVDEDGRYNGEISQDYIAEYLSSGRTRRALNIHSELIFPAGHRPAFPHAYLC